MIVDTSALVSILFDEPGHERFEAALSTSTSVRMAAPNWLELLMVIDARTSGTALPQANAMRQTLDIEIVPFDLQLAEAAHAAHRRFGRGNHPARLNFGDCMAYALARATGEPLLFKGDDFSQTDIPAALA